MLRSLFLKNWCRTSVKKTVCAVTLSSLLLASGSAMGYTGIILGKDTTEGATTIDLASFVGKNGFTENADGSGYTIDLGGDECAISLWNGGEGAPAENTIDLGGKTLYVNGKDPSGREGCASVVLEAWVDDPIALTINGSLHSTFDGGRISESAGVIIVNEQPPNEGPIYLHIKGDVHTEVANMNISRGKYGSYGVGIADGDFTVEGNFYLRMTNISDWDTKWDKPLDSPEVVGKRDRAKLYALGLGTGIVPGLTGSNQYTFEKGLEIDGVQHVSSSEAVVTKQMSATGIDLDARARSWLLPSANNADFVSFDRTMTVKEGLKVKNVSVEAYGLTDEIKVEGSTDDKSQAGAYGFHAISREDSNVSVTVEGASEISGISATTNSGAMVYAAGLLVENAPEEIKVGETDGGAPIYKALNGGKIEMNLKGGLTVNTVSAFGDKDSGENKNPILAQDALTSSEAYGLAIYGNRNPNIAVEKAPDISVTVEGTTVISGIKATLNNGNKSGTSTYAAGIEAGAGSDEAHKATVNLKGDVTIEEVSASGGDANEAYAIVAFNNAAVNINADASADKTVVVRGDTQTAGDNAAIVMNLGNAQSEFRGYTLDIPGEGGTNATDIGLSNGGTWYVPGENHLKGTLTMGNDGHVRMPAPGGAFTTLTVDKLSGKGGVFHMSVDTEKADADRLVIVNGSGEHYLSFENTSKNAGKKDILVVTQKSGNASFLQANEVTVGNYTYTLRTDTLGNGSSLTYLTPTEQLAPVTLASLSMASLGAECSAYLSNVSNLRSRLGEVRGRTARKGLWGQLNFWKDRADSFGGTSLSQDVMAVSAGYDVMPNKKWIVGAGISAATHDQTGRECVGRVSGDANSFSFTPYGTWMHNNGTYVDIVGSVGVYDQDFDLYRPGQAGVSGSYTDFGAGVSVEVGRKFTSRRAMRTVDAKGATVSTTRRAPRGWFVEPQAQLSFYAVFADDYTTSEGSSAKRDDATFLTGRIGVVAGKDFTYKGSKKGQVYAKAGFIHEFCGDQEVVFNGERFSEDSILGSRFYYGIGADMELRGNLRAYGEIGREEGAHYTREYDVRCGIKFSY